MHWIIVTCFALGAVIRVHALPVEFFKAKDVQTTLPLPPPDYPEALQGMLWMDQTGYYAHSDVPSGAPDAALSFGDTVGGKLDPDSRSIYVNTQGPAWSWFNEAEAYAMYATGGEGGYHYKFEFNSDYTHAKIYPYVKSIYVPSGIVSFSMERQFPPAGACPPKEGASKQDIAKCAKWKRVSHGPFGVGGDFLYYAFEIVDRDGNPVEPYYGKYLEWASQHCKPSSSAASMAQLSGFDETGTFSQPCGTPDTGTLFRGTSWPSMALNKLNSSVMV